MQHHTKYLELDGVDEIIEVTPEEHGLFQMQRGFAIPRDVVIKAHRRSPKHLEYDKEYMKDYNPDYKKKNLRTKRFTLTVEPLSYVRVCIEVNQKTDTITVYNQFEQRYNVKP